MFCVSVFAVPTSHAHFILRIFTARALCVLLTNFVLTRSLSARGYDAPFAPWSFIARTLHTLCPLVSIFIPLAFVSVLDGLFRSLSITLLMSCCSALSQQSLRKCVLGRSRLLSLSVTMAHCCVQTQPFAHLTTISYFCVQGSFRYY
ncbi:hypothetical protein BC826DRAFT_509791 [Russula brevipes]|nr:hypothetical protein BC826DRAFT_509791 [Russula brevipes]